MLSVLKNRTYRHLFAAQVIALVGTGLMTVALGLLAYDLAGANAGAVLGTALAIKMLAYVGVAPVAQAFADRLPRRSLLVALDLVRASVALCLPFVSEIWQIYLLIFVLQAASAGFTPTFKPLSRHPSRRRRVHESTVAFPAGLRFGKPDFPDAGRRATDGHQLPQPVCRNGSRLPRVSRACGQREASHNRSRPASWHMGSHYAGTRIYLATPRLRGLLAISLAVAAAGSMVIVNTVVIVKARFGLGESEVAWALAAFGGGSMVAAFALPRLLDKIADRPVMIAGATMLVVGTAAGAMIPTYAVLVVIWLVVGFGYSVAQTPSGRLLRRSAHPEDRPRSLPRNSPLPCVLAHLLSLGRSLRRCLWAAIDLHHHVADWSCRSGTGAVALAR